MQVTNDSAQPSAGARTEKLTEGRSRFYHAALVGGRLPRLPKRGGHVRRIKRKLKELLGLLKGCDDPPGRDKGPR